MMLTLKGALKKLIHRRGTEDAELLIFFLLFADPGGIGFAPMK